MRKTPKTMYILYVTRGRRTKFFYGEKLKDALAAANLKSGEKFTYAKFIGGKETDAVWRDGVYSTER